MKVKYKILCSDFVFRFCVQILCSDFVFRFCVQIWKMCWDPQVSKSDTAGDYNFEKTALLIFNADIYCIKNLKKVTQQVHN